MTKDPREGKKIYPQQWENWIPTSKRIKLNHYLTPHTKIKNGLKV